MAGRALQTGWEQTLDNKMEQKELNTCTTKTHCLSSGAQRAAFRLHQKQARSQAAGDFSYDLHLLVLRDIVAINTHVLTEVWKPSRCYEDVKSVSYDIFVIGPCEGNSFLASPLCYYSKSVIVLLQLQCTVSSELSSISIITYLASYSSLFSHILSNHKKTPKQ